MADPFSPADTDQSTPRSSRRSARSQHVEIITRAERRRWSIELKREIVAESLGPDLTPSEVIRKHGITSGQLYTWRRELLIVQTAMVPTARRFVEVEAAAPTAPRMDGVAASADTQPPSTSPAAARPDGLIEIVMPGGVVLRMDAHVDGRALRRVLGALVDR